MLDELTNDRLSQIGPGTPAGNLFRNYWLPIAGSSEFSMQRPTKRVRILSEDLVLYKDKSGTFGLIGESCAHRRISMYYGIPELNGLRCPYHGWLFDETGRCIEQPAEPEGSTFKDKVRMTAYPVQELGGLLFAYLGESPAPLLPRWDLFTWGDMYRQVGVTVIPCNWLQAMENSIDQTHVEWLHGYYTNYLAELRADASGKEFKPKKVRQHLRIGFDRFEHGIIKRRIEAGGSEQDDDWQIGHPLVFPFILKTGAAHAPSFQIRVPIDDTHTLHFLYKCYRPGVPFPAQDEVPIYDLPWQKEDGDAIVDFTLAQDMMAWITQGAIASRELESLGQADTGIILYRQLLEEQLDLVEAGKDPINVFRNPSENELLLLPQEKVKHGSNEWGRRSGEGDSLSNYLPRPDFLDEIFDQTLAKEKSGETVLADNDTTLSGAVARDVALKK